MNFQTIAKTAALTGISANHLRTLQRQGKLPGFFAGSRFYIDVDLFCEQLRRECEANSGAHDEER